MNKENREKQSQEDALWGVLEVINAKGDTDELENIVKNHPAKEIASPNSEK